MFFSQILFSLGLLNSLPNDKIIDLSNFKAFAGNKMNVAEKLKFAFRMLENIVFKMFLSQGHLKSGLSGKELTLYHDF